MFDALGYSPDTLCFLVLGFLNVDFVYEMDEIWKSEGVRDGRVSNLGSQILLFPWTMSGLSFPLAPRARLLTSFKIPPQSSSSTVARHFLKNRVGHSQTIISGQTELLLSLCGFQPN